jgi:uncharacterized membrane protein
MSFFEKYFINPIIFKEGYNIINTTFYALLFLLFSFFAFNLLKKMKIKINLYLIISITPLILSAIIVRVLNDADILKGYIFVTPNIWILSFFIIVLFLLLSYFFEKKFDIPYYKIMFISGFSIFSFLLGTVKINNYLALLYTIAFLLPTILIILFLKLSLENKLVLGIQTFDSIVTAISVTWFGYTEQHVLPKFIIETTGTAFSFILVKFSLVYISLFIIDISTKEDKEFSNFTKLLIGILGISTGGRSFLRLLCGV